MRYWYMPKRSRNRDLASDPNVSAFKVLQRTVESNESSQKNPAAVALGRRGGLKGGKARAAKLSDAQRSASASKAAKARWEAEKKRAG
jgi:hypothetical protein